MLQVTKKFNFEMSHAIHDHDGTCKNVHGHSYGLHVTVCQAESNDNFLPQPGFIIDFKILK